MRPVYTGFTIGILGFRIGIFLGGGGVRYPPAPVGKLEVKKIDVRCRFFFRAPSAY